jgi:hypothetical protein
VEELALGTGAHRAVGGEAAAEGVWAVDLEVGHARVAAVVADVAGAWARLKDDGRRLLLLLLLLQLGLELML